MKEELKKYFKNMFINVDKNIVLDNDQIKAIMNDDDYVLVLAGAGTGKTTTMVGKVKYLVDIKHVDPSKILVISYTKKAVEELQELIIDEFGINTNVTTFHSLAYKYIRNIFKNRKCTVVDFNQREEIFYEYMNESFKSKKIDDLLETFNEETLNNKKFFYGRFFLNNYKNYDNYDELFKKYKEFKIEEANNIGIKSVIDDWVTKRLQSDDILITIRGDVVKSVGEAVIANFLYVHGIDYLYEEVYSEIVEDRKTYKPDFTLDLAGQKVYLEYFGLDNPKYIENKKKKIKMHMDHNNKFLFIDYTDIKAIEKELDRLLKENGFIYRDRTYEEIYNAILDNNKLSQLFKLKNLFYDSILQIKESLNRDSYLSIVRQYISALPEEEQKNCLKQFGFINNFYSFYSKKLYNAEIYGFDYADLIHYANKYISSKEFINDLNYDYIIIDEYQDISDGEYLLARKTVDKSKSKVFAVGDDWQSIYAFRGSNISYITDFEHYFKKTTKLKIRNTYRNSQELVDVAGDFIMKNEDQIKKELISNKNMNKPIHFVLFDDRDENGLSDETIEYKELKKLIFKIHEVSPNHSILILARTNRAIDNCFEFDKDFINDLGTKIKISSIENLRLDGMTIHKSKGLTYDEVIIIGMNDKFPSDEHSRYWIVDLFKPKRQKEAIEYPEDRRIFYVALTRTKNNVFILTNKNAKHRSKFIDELMKIEKEVKERKDNT